MLRIIVRIQIREKWDLCGFFAVKLLFLPLYYIMRSCGNISRSKYLDFCACWSAANSNSHSPHEPHSTVTFGFLQIVGSCRKYIIVRARCECICGCAWVGAGSSKICLKSDAPQILSRRKMKYFHSAGSCEMWHLIFTLCRILDAAPLFRLATCN